MIALDKPAGQLVHPSPRKNEGTLANALLGYYERTDQPCGIHPVTRLDRDTFGVVLLAKNAHIHAKLCQLMKDGAIHKTYLASVFGCPEQPAGEIALPVYKLGNGSLLRMVDPRGKRAVSRYRVISSDHQTSILALNPVTGRTHQLLPALQGGSFPILGDHSTARPRPPLFRHARAVLPAAAGGKAGAYAPRDGQPLVISSRQSVSAGDEQVHADALRPRWQRARRLKSARPAQLRRVVRQIGACKLPECFSKRRVADFGLQELREPLELRAIFGSIITLNQKAQSFPVLFSAGGKPPSRRRQTAPRRFRQ